jgi:zinc transport system permease protein
VLIDYYFRDVSLDRDSCRTLVLLVLLFYEINLSLSLITLRKRRVAVKFLNYAMMFFIAVTIVLSIRLVGIMLLMSLLTLPQMIVNQFTSNYRKIMYGSVFVGFLACVEGLILSYYINIPSGAFIILVLTFLFFCVKGVLVLAAKQ